MEPEPKAITERVSASRPRFFSPGDKLRKNLEPSDYKRVALSLIFLKAYLKDKVLSELRGAWFGSPRAVRIATLPAGEQIRGEVSTLRFGLTELGPRRFCCRHCGRRFNERTGTPDNWLQYPTDIVLLVVRWRRRYKLSLRNLAEMFLEHGFVFTHETVREWQAKLARLIAEQLRMRRRPELVGR